MIEIQGVQKKFGDTLAVDNLDLTVQNGEIFGFLGPNGAGKTTTIRMIAGILQPDAGRIFLDGVDVAAEPLKAKMRFGYVPDEPNLFLRLKGREYLNFIADIYGVDKALRKPRIERLAEAFGLTNALGDSLMSYSHGMRQKIIVMGVLIHEPALWILDEPMTGLDPKSAAMLKELMREHVKAGNTVFFSTHVLDVAEKICDRVGIIHKGRLRFCGTLDEMRAQQRNNESLEEMFLSLTEV